MQIFIADVQSKGLVVYDSSVKSMCRVESDYMIPTENLASIANQTFPYNRGISSVVTLYNGKYLHSIAINIILNVIYNI